MIIAHGSVLSEDGIFETRNVYTHEDKICDQSAGDGSSVIDATDCYVLPRPIDIHFHGCAGYDFCDGTAERLEHMRLPYAPPAIPPSPSVYTTGWAVSQQASKPT